MSTRTMAFKRGRDEVQVSSVDPMPVTTAPGGGSGAEYETVAASQTAQALGATGATGDYISRVIITPATTAPGVVTLLDNATSIPLWIGGTVGADLTPIVIELGMVSVSGAWKITTGANVTVIAVGSFT